MCKASRGGGRGKLSEAFFTIERRIVGGWRRPMDDGTVIRVVVEKHA